MSTSLPSFLKVIAVAVLAAVALGLTGCQQGRPARPDPSATVMGPQAGDLAFRAQADAGLVGDPDSLLQARDPLSLALEKGGRGVIEPVLFAFDSAAIRPGDRPKVEAAARWLKENAGSRVLLEGYCDWRGTTEYNMGLGDRRARSVQNFLRTLGIEAARIETLSKGDIEAKEGASEAEMTRDRRVEFVIRR